MVSRICKSACGCSALPGRAVVGRLVDAMMGDFCRALWMVALLAICLPAFSRSGAEIPLPSLDGPIPNTPVSHTWNGAAWQKVPIARYKGVYAPDPDCRNAVMPFDRQTLESLYPAPGDYLDQYTAATQALLDGGFLLPEDASKLIEAAGQRRVP